MAAAVTFRPPRQVLVLHAGYWRRGQALAARRDETSGWRLLVSYRVEHEIGSLSYQHWRPAAEVRPGDESAPHEPAPVARHLLFGQWNR